MATVNKDVDGGPETGQYKCPEQRYAPGGVEPRHVGHGARSRQPLLILNDPSYGTERSFNGLRLAKDLAGKGAEVTVFLMADAVACAKAGQKVPQGYYNLELMTKSIICAGEVLVRDLYGRPRYRRCRVGGGRAAQHPGRVGGGHPRGGPGARVLIRWTDLEPLQLADELVECGYEISRNTAAKLLQQAGYRRRSLRKELITGRVDAQERDQQVRYIDALRR